MLRQPSSRQAESKLDGAPRVPIPIAPLIRTQPWRAVANGAGDHIGLMSRQPKADSDLGVDPRRVGLPCPPLSSNVGEMDAIRVCQRSRRAGSALLVMDFDSTPVALGRNGVLQLRVGDLEPVLHRQFHADPPERFVSVNREGAPLLSAELERGEDRLAAVAVADVDHFPSVGEGGRAALAVQVIVDPLSVYDRLKCADVARCRLVECGPLDRGRLSFPVSPFLRELWAALCQPRFEGRESLHPSKLGTLQGLLVSERGFLLGLLSGQNAPRGVEEIPLALPGLAEDVGPLAPMAPFPPRNTSRLGTSTSRSGPRPSAWPRST